MKALAALAACLTLGLATPSYAVAIISVPHAPPGPHAPPQPHPAAQPHADAQPHAQATRAPSSHFHHGYEDAGIGYPQEVPDDTAALGDAADEPVVLAPAERCPAAEPVVVRSSGPHILYIGQKPPVQANLPKIIYGTD
jgi:hypothetical protein